MKDKDTFIEEQVKQFKEALKGALEIAVDPENVKWSIFSTGDKKLEESVLETLVDSMLTKVEGVFIFRPEDPQQCLRFLKQAQTKLEKEYIEAYFQNPDSKFTLKYGVENE